MRAVRLSALAAALAAAVCAGPGPARSDQDDVQLLAVRLDPGSAPPGVGRVRVTGRVKNLTSRRFGANDYEVLVRATDVPSYAPPKDRLQWRARVPEVDPGETRDVTPVELLAPEAAGRYAFEVLVVQRDRRVSNTERVDLDVPWVQDATVESIRMEGAPDPGEKVSVAVTVRNTGHCVWTPAARLVCEVSRTYSGSEDAAEEAFARTSDATGRVVEPGSTFTFDYDVVAPVNQPLTGVWDLAWQVQDGERGTTRLGATKSLKVTVAGELGAEVRRISVERKLTPGKDAKVRVTLKNTGTVQWSGREYVLVCDNVTRPKNVARPPTFAFEKPLDRDVDVGGEVTLEGTLEVPTDPGEWTLRCGMIKSKQAFGETAEQEVEVLPAFEVTIVDVRMEDEVDLNRSFDVQVKVRNTGPATWYDDEMFLQVTPVKALYGSDLDDAKRAFTFTLPVPSSKRIDPNDALDLSTRRTGPTRPGTWEVEFQMMVGRKPFGVPVRRRVAAR